MFALYIKINKFKLRNSKVSNTMRKYFGKRILLEEDFQNMKTLKYFL